MTVLDGIEREILKILHPTKPHALKEIYQKLLATGIAYPTLTLNKTRIALRELRSRGLVRSEVARVEDSKRSTAGAKLIWYLNYAKED